MPDFSLSTQTAAPVEEVWKLLHDPGRFPEWWAGVETVAVTEVAPQDAAYTMWPDGYPDFPMEQRLHAAPGRVTISCLVSDLVFVWQLREADPSGASGSEAAGTIIEVHVQIPEREAHRVADQHRLIQESLASLCVLATAG